jgi:hypothetical protein
VLAGVLGQSRRRGRFDAWRPGAEARAHGVRRFDDKEGADVDPKAEGSRGDEEQRLCGDEVRGVGQLIGPEEARELSDSGG